MKILISFYLIMMLVVPAHAEIEMHEGFPVQAGYGLRVPLIAQDLEGDGNLEIIAAPENRMVKVFNNTGALMWENVGGSSMYDYGRVPLVSNLSGDGRLEVMSYGNPGYSDATLYIWDSLGNKLNETLVGRYLLISSPAITKEGIILTGAAPGRSFGTIINATGVHALDSLGNKLWYLELGRSVNFFAPIVTGELDDDGKDEAIVLTHDISSAYPTDGTVWAIEVNSQGTVLWSKVLGGDVRGAAAGDLNRDGKNEVVAVSSAGVFVLDRNGNELYNFTINTNRASPAIGDLEGDGINEVLMASNYDKMIYIISNGSLRGFSSTGRLSCNLALGDLNADGKLEIAAGDINRNIYVWDYMGKVMEQRRADGPVEYFSSALIADLEGDGNKEIILGNHDGTIYAYTYRIKPKDITPPLTTDDVEGLWHNSGVTVTLKAEDAESGVAATYYTTDGSPPTLNSPQGSTINLSGEGIYTVRYFSIDRAGNIETVRTAGNQVKIDRTAPVTSDDADASWHNGSVALRFSALDSGSGVFDTYYTTDGSAPAAGSQNGTNVTVAGEGIHTIKYFSIDNAGNAEPLREAAVKVDLTPPVTADDSDNVWHNTDVILNLTVSDSLSGARNLFYGIDGVWNTSSGNVLLAIGEEGVHTVEYYGADKAGNMEKLKTTTVKIDRTPPSTTDNVDGEWHSTSFTVKLSAADNLAGVNSTYYIMGTETLLGSVISWLRTMLGVAETRRGDSVTVSDEGVFGVHYYSTDNAGNIEAEMTSLPVKLDKTMPVITVNVPENRTYLHSDVITLSFTSSDALSGIKTVNSAIDGDRNVRDGETLDMLYLNPGVHELSITAFDNAGNLNLRKVDFKVIITIDSLIALNERAISSGWINNSNVSRSLQAKLDSAKKNIEAGRKAAAVNVLEAYMNEIGAQSGKHVTTEGAGIMASEAGYVIQELLAV